MSDSLEFDQKWQALRERFVARLGVRLRSIETSWGPVRSGQDPVGSSRSALFHHIHSLAGSGATFGFIKLAQAARVIEVPIDPLHVPLEQALGEETLQALTVALEQLVVELKRLNPELE